MGRRVLSGRARALLLRSSDDMAWQLGCVVRRGLCYVWFEVARGDARAVDGDFGGRGGGLVMGCGGCGRRR